MEEISPIKQRILQFIDLLGITKADFCNITGISYSNLKGKSLQSEFGGVQIVEILTKYPSLSTDWLLTGRGDMLRNTAQIQSNTEQSTAIATPVTNSNSEGIPLIPTAAMAGVACGEIDIQEYECERYIVPVFKKANYLIQISGDSMIPTFHSGDLVACMILPLTDIFFQWNKIYVLDTKQGALIKRIKPGHDKEHLLIVSDNTAYAPFELHISQINSIAIVLGLIRSINN